MKKSPKILLILMILLSSAFQLQSQQDLHARSYDFHLGFYGNYNYNLSYVDVPGSLNYIDHSGHVGGVTSGTDLPGDICCINEFYGKGWSFSGGLQIAYPVYERVSLSGRIGLSNFFGIYSSSDVFPVTSGDNIYIGESEYELKIDLLALTFEPAVNFRLFHNMNLTASAGISYSVNSNFYETNVIRIPSYPGGFDQSEREKGKLNNKEDLLYNIAVGLSYDLPLNTGLYISPEVFFLTGMNSLNRTFHWDVGQVRFGAAFKFAP